VQHEEAAQRIVDGDPAEELRDHDRRATEPMARGRPVGNIAAGGVRAADDEVRVARPQALQHRGQQRFIVLQVGVEDRDERCRGCEHPLDAGRGQTAPADAPQATDPPVTGREFANPIGRVVGTVVVDEHDLPRQAGEGAVEPLDEAGHVVPLIEGGDDDGKIRRGSGRKHRLRGS
jgi:hypothetical protein